MKTPTPEDLEYVFMIIDDVQAQFQREQDQGILKRDLYQSVEAMGGRDACERIKRSIHSRVEMIHNAERVRAIDANRKRQR